MQDENLRRLVREILLESEEEESDEPSFWKEVGKTIMGPEDKPSFSREVVKTVKRAVAAAPETIESWIKNSPQVVAFMLAPAGLRSTIIKGTIDAFLGAPANAPGPNDETFTRSAWVLTQMHAILQAAGSALDPADVVDAILYFAEAASTEDDAKKKDLLNNGAISMVAAVPAFGAAFAAGRAIKGAQLASHIDDMKSALDVPEAVSLLGQQGVRDAKASIDALQQSNSITHAAIPARMEYAEQIVDYAKKEAIEKLERHIQAQEKISRGDFSQQADLLPNIRSGVDADIARKASIHGKTGGYTVPATPAANKASNEIERRSRKEMLDIGANDAHIAQSSAGITAASRWGVGTNGITFKTAHGSVGTILISPSGEKYAYYVSSGTGSGTPTGSWVPYKGQAISIDIHDPYGAHAHVVKIEPTSKVPAVNAGESRDVYDAANHPDVRDNLKKMTEAPGFEDGNVDWDNVTLGNLAVTVDKIGRENAYLHSMGVKIGGGDISKNRQYLMPWPHDIPVPSDLSGKVITSNDISQLLRWSEKDARGIVRTGTYQEWFNSRSSALLSMPVKGNPALRDFRITQTSSTYPVIGKL